jgi:histone-arginine methyltransferase CARM1
MLQDSIRTSMYQTAIISNAQQLFQGKKVMDLGAGSGILSYFAVKAGAAAVYAVEASDMADKIKKLMDHTNVSNTWLAGKLHVIKGSHENLLQEKLKRLKH